VFIERSVWIYWACCLAAAAAIVAQRHSVTLLLSPNSGSAKKAGYKASVTLGWLATFATALTYALLTRKFETGSYRAAELVTFAVVNGVLEQFMFIFWFLMGCYLAKISAPGKPILAFGFGYVAYVVYSGLIHGLFWVAVLPAHRPVTFIMVVLLSITSLVWMWLFWRYRAIVSIVAMHIVVDILMIGHLHSAWFEDYQLL
jgi:chlorophyllide a hydrolase